MGKRTGKANGPIAPWKHRVKEVRRKAAEERQAKYNKLTTAEKLLRLDAGGFTATKERTKLAGKLIEEIKKDLKDTLKPSNNNKNKGVKHAPGR
jgi:hypothetical protein